MSHNVEKLEDKYEDVIGVKNLLNYHICFIVVEMSRALMYNLIKFSTNIKNMLILKETLLMN